MAVHLSNVNFRNLIQDLADMYSFSIPEVVITELIANSLDAGATRIDISYSCFDRLLVVEDNGSGMSKKQFDEYHDFAAGLKSRGTGIGFAGLGSKISFNTASRVGTETHSSSFKGGSNWYLKSEKELVWENVSKLTSLRHKGTRVEVWFNDNADISFDKTEELELLLLRHYLPLFDGQFLKVYDTLKFYSDKLRFTVNGKTIKPFDLKERFGLENIKPFFLEIKGKRYGYGIFGLSTEEFPLGDDIAGVGFSVYGKLIQFDLFNQFPGVITPRIFGVVEVPPFIDFLNTPKSGFIRRKATAGTFRKYYEPIRQEFKNWLVEIGIKPVEAINTEEAVKLEQEIKKIINDLPELYQFFGLSIQKKIIAKNPAGDISGQMIEGAQETFPIGEGLKKGRGGIVDAGDEPGEALIEKTGGGERASPITRSRRAGVRITFIDSPDRLELAWLDGNIIVINSGHPSYLKAKNNNYSRRLHNIFSIAVSLDREMKGQGILNREESFIDKMMLAWGNVR